MSPECRVTYVSGRTLSKYRDWGVPASAGNFLLLRKALEFRSSVRRATSVNHCVATSCQRAISAGRRFAGPPVMRGTTHNSKDAFRMCLPLVSGLTASGALKGEYVWVQRDAYVNALGLVDRASSLLVALHISIGNARSADDAKVAVGWSSAKHRLPVSQRSAVRGARHLSGHRRSR
jgi:hypothetical protein